MKYEKVVLDFETTHLLKHFRPDLWHLLVIFHHI